MDLVCAPAMSIIRRFGRPGCLAFAALVLAGGCDPIGVINVRNDSATDVVVDRRTLEEDGIWRNQFVVAPAGLEVTVAYDGVGLPRSSAITLMDASSCAVLATFDLDASFADGAVLVVSDAMVVVATPGSQSRRGEARATEICAQSSDP